MITHAASRKHYYTVLLDRSLGDAVYIASGVTLQGGHGCDHHARAAAIANAPARHGVGLAETGDDDCAGIRILADGGGGDVLHPIINQRFVNLIADDGEHTSS